MQRCGNSGMSAFASEVIGGVDGLDTGLVFVPVFSHSYHPSRVANPAGRLLKQSVMVAYAGTWRPPIKISRRPQSAHFRLIEVNIGDAS